LPSYWAICTNTNNGGKPKAQALLLVIANYGAICTNTNNGGYSARNLTGLKNLGGFW